MNEGKYCGPDKEQILLSAWAGSAELLPAIGGLFVPVGSATVRSRYPRIDDCHGLRWLDGARAVHKCGGVVLAQDEVMRRQRLC